MSSALDIEYDFKEALISSKGILTIVFTFLLIWLIREAYRTNIPKLNGIPDVPGALPFVGHLHLLGGRSGRNDATVFTDWSKKLNDPPFIQARLGDQRIVIVKDCGIVKDLWIGHSGSMLDRPPQPGFLEKLGVDLSSSPMTDQIRRCRAAGMRALGKPMWPKYYQWLELNSTKFVKDVYQNGKNGAVFMDPYSHLRQIVFDVTLSLTYGARFGEVDDSFTLGLIKSINGISAVRSSTETYRHYVPILRLIPESTSETIESEKARAKHLEVLYNSYKNRVASGETVDCIVASLGEDKLTEEEIHGTCVSLLQAAPDTVASGVYMALAWLSSPEGQPTQQRLYDAILEAYGGDRDLAWKMAFREEKVPLITSINKETLRFFTTAPYATPRYTNKDIEYKGFSFPVGTTFYLNAQDANHSTEHFGSDAWEYKPDRYIGNDNPLPHYSFGLGARICPAVAISNRIICAVLTRTILAFELREPETPGARKPNIHPLDFSDVYNQLVAHPRFYDSCFIARDQQWLEMTLNNEKFDI